MTASLLSLNLVNQSSSVAVVKKTKRQLPHALTLSGDIMVPACVLTLARRTFIQIKGLLSGAQFSSGY